MLDMRSIESFFPENLRHFKRNMLREYLQYKILEAVFSSDYAHLVTFMGGTAIHIIHGNTRFSEDLDFDNSGLDKSAFSALTELVRKRLEKEGFRISTKTVFGKDSASHFRIPGAFYDYGISSDRKEVLLIKMDAEPQNFAYEKDKPIINRFGVFLRINAAPAGLLLSQKICAIFTRKRPMGRDFYDVIFLMGKTGPDFSYLSEKLGIKNNTDLKNKLLEKCKGLNFEQLARDTEPFLFNPEDAKKIPLFRDYVAQTSA